MLYFKNDFHKSEMYDLLARVDLNDPDDDREYGSLCYMIAATGKGSHLKSYLSPEGIDLDQIEEKMLVFSNSERQMIYFGLQLFNRRFSDVTIGDVLFSLDDQNKKVILSAIKFRYNIKE